MPAVTWLLLALVVLALPVSARGTDWVRVETPHLIVFGPGEKKTREVTAEFERFREAIGHVLGTAVTTSAVPTTVVVFENDAAFNPYRPKYNGKTVRLGGFYSGTESDNLIAFPYGDPDRGLRIIFHEYTHLITANASRALPPWVSEGLAEFYSTFEISKNGKEALLGQVIPSHVQRLTTSGTAWLPLDQLLAVTHESPLYNEGERRSIFYAQSWAIVHLLMTGEPNRTREFNRYLQLTAGGASPLDAWTRVFGDLDIQKELRRYLSRFTLRGFLYKFKEGVGPLDARVMTPKPGDVDAVLGRLLRYGDEAAVEPALRRAAAATPPSMLARALLGNTWIERNRDEEGVQLLLEAATDTSDWLVQYYVARGFARRQVEPAPDVAAAGKKAADAVVAARPRLANAHALKARLAEGAEALAAIRHARALAPGREDYAFLEAQRHADLRDFPAARTALAPLLGPNYPPDVREQARMLMGQIVRLEEMQARLRATPSNARPAALPAGAQWIFRQVGVGEQRVEGILERIDCARSGAATFAVRIGGEVKLFAARQFADVELIAYRDLTEARISCGVRQAPEPVYVTWRPLETPSAGIIGRPVAVEFLPEKR